MDSPGPSKQDHYRTTGQARKGEKDKRNIDKIFNVYTALLFPDYFFFLSVKSKKRVERNIVVKKKYIYIYIFSTAWHCTK